MRAFRTLVFATGVCCLGLPQLVARIAAADPAQPSTPKKETASQSTSPPRSANAPSWDLQGVVVNESGIPIAHAKVTARVYPLDHSVETGADGSFAMTIARKPTLFALIHAKDQASGLQGFVRLQDSKVLEQQTPIRVILKKPRDIAITVTDQSDKPVEHAKVAANSMFGNFEQRETDSAGKAVFHIPAGLPLRSVFAVKPDVGLDYIDYSQARHGGDTQNQSLEKDSQLKFVLGGARTVNVRVTDRQGKPVVGAQVNPSYFTLPKKAALHLFDEDLLAQVTDSHGNASFRFIPSANFGPILFNVRLADHVVVERPTFDPKSKSGDITALLVPLVRIRGRVTTAEGRPAVAAEIRADGFGYEFDDFHQSAKCDTHGEFELRVAPNKYYTFSARRDPILAPIQNRTIFDGAAVEPLKFVLKMGTRVYGRVTRGKDKSPVPHQFVSLQQKLGNDYYELPKDQQLPNPKKSSRWIGAQSSQNVETDATGRFEFYVAPGQYNVQLNGAWDQRPPVTKVEDQDVEVNLVDKRPDRSVLRGRVVLKTDPKRSVPEARVEAASTDQAPGFNDFRSFADGEGKFEFNRSEINMLVWAREGSLAGAVRIAPGDKTVVVCLAPTATATGKFVDSQTGLPAANRRIDYGVQLPERGGPFSWYFGGSATTDAEGRFTMEHLTGGLKYQIEAVIQSNSEGPQGWHTVTAITPKEGERIDLGELKYPAPARPYTPPTLEELIGRAMDVKKPLDARLEGELIDARLFENYVLVFAASPKSDVCRRFFAILNRRNSRDGDEEASEVLGDFTRLAIDASRRERATELKTHLARWNLSAPASDDAALAILDHDGRLVAATTAKQLWPGKTIDAKPLTAFLKQHLPPMPDAQRRLADALAQARRENKRVLVEQSAAWCGWCHVLAKYLDRHRSLVEKDYVWITIDPRFAHGEAVIKKLRPKAEGGIPWMAILDADGKPLITSDGPEGNIGYPGEPSGVEHFEKMLRTTARHMSDAEIKILLADTRKK